MANSITILSLAIGQLLLVTTILAQTTTSSVPTDDTWESLPPVVIHGQVQQNTQCPTQEQREAAHRNLSSEVQRLIPIILTNMDRESVPVCGGGRWQRVFSLNMSDTTQECPTSWRQYTDVRACGRPVGGRGCASHIFDVNEIEYSRVCGRIIAYQFSDPDAFRSSNIDTYYLDGISMTYGMPRNHIWSFASSWLRRPNQCPCAESSRFLPAFVGEHYFCESANERNDGSDLGRTFTQDLLWDGQNCVDEANCCTGSVPWFTREFPSPTTDDIEVRICGDEGTNNEDTPIKILDIYIQ